MKELNYLPEGTLQNLEFQIYSKMDMKMIIFSTQRYGIKKNITTGQLIHTHLSLVKIEY